MSRGSSNETCYTHSRLIDAVIVTECTTLLACNHSFKTAGTWAAIARCGGVTASTFSHAGRSPSTPDPHHIFIVRRWGTIWSPHLGTCTLHQHVVPHLALCNLNHTTLINMLICYQILLTMPMNNDNKYTILRIQ